MITIEFKLLWKNHPYPEKPCDPIKFENQCAIRMGVALEKSGVDTSSFDTKFLENATKKGTRCWLEHTPGHILRAEELANWLETKSDIFGKPEKSQHRVTSDKFKDRTGIIFIKDGWPRGGDHIDVWNGTELKGGSLAWFELGKDVWFWAID